MSKLLVLTRYPAEYEPNRFKEEAKKKKIDTKILNYSRISFTWDKQGLSIFLGGKK